MNAGSLFMPNIQVIIPVITIIFWEEDSLSSTDYYKRLNKKYDSNKAKTLYTDIYSTSRKTTNQQEIRLNILNYFNKVN